MILSVGEDGEVSGVVTTATWCLGTVQSARNVYTPVRCTVITVQVGDSHLTYHDPSLILCDNFQPGMGLLSIIKKFFTNFIDKYTHFNC